MTLAELGVHGLIEIDDEASLRERRVVVAGDFEIDRCRPSVWQPQEQLPGGEVDTQMPDAAVLGASPER